MKSYLCFVSMVFIIIAVISCGQTQPEKKRHRLVRIEDRVYDSSMKWASAMKDFQEADAENPPADDTIVFVGSSSVRMWSTLSQDMAPLPVINRGFGGSRFEDVNYFISNLVWDYEPEIVVVYEGDNDVAADGDSPQAVLSNYLKFVELTHSQLSNTLIYFLSIKPSPSRAASWNDMQAANALIKDYTTHDDRLFYLDVSTPMLDKNGEMMTNIYLADDLHMNAEGYTIWTDVVKPAMESAYDRLYSE